MENDVLSTSQGTSPVTPESAVQVAAQSSRPDSRKQVWLFIGLTFVISWTFMIGAIIPAFRNMRPESTGMDGVLVAVLEASVMFVPALCALLTRLITHDWTNLMLRPFFREHRRTWLWAWFAPMLLIVVGAALYFLVFQDHFSLDRVKPQLVGDTAMATALKSFVMLLVICSAPALNAINCFGEEWGWRGFLLPKMMDIRRKDGTPRYRFLGVSLLTGFIWGIWHAPIIAIGHNYRMVMGTNTNAEVALAVVAMCLFCIMLAIIQNYLTLKARSVWPAVIVHGAVNGVAGIGMLFLVTDDMANAFVGPAPTGLVGAIPFLLVAVGMVIRMRAKEKAASAVQ